MCTSTQNFMDSLLPTQQYWYVQEVGILPIQAAFLLAVTRIFGELRKYLQTAWDVRQSQYCPPGSFHSILQARSMAAISYNGKPAPISQAFSRSCDRQMKRIFIQWTVFLRQELAVQSLPTLTKILYPEKIII